MSSTLSLIADAPTQEDRYKYYEKIIQGELALPFSVQGHQFAISLLESVNPKNYQKLERKIWRRFYRSRDGE